MPSVIQNLRCEYLSVPLGIDSQSPRLSWEITLNGQSLSQSAYQILVASSEDLLAQDRGDLWDSGKVNASACAQIEYEGDTLKSGQRCFWKVRIWDEEDRALPYSHVSIWEMALLKPKDWTAQWITHIPNDGGVTLIHSPLLRKEFCLSDKIQQARLYVCGLGYYEAYLNGEKIGDHALAPQTTQTSHSILYDVFDVTKQLSKGDNALGIWLHSGYYYREIPGVEHRTPILLLQLDVVYQSGKKERIISDKTWRSAVSPISHIGRHEGIDFGGELYKSEMEQEGWDASGFSDENWADCQETTPPSGTLKVRYLEPNRVSKTIKACKQSQLTADTMLYDFGTCLTGRIRLKVSASNLASFTVRYYDAVDEEGRPDPYFHFNQTDIYCAANGDNSKSVRPYVNKEQSWAPRFSYRGFRYVTVQSAWSGRMNAPEIIDIEAELMHNDLETAGTFECSDPTLNKIVEVSKHTQLCLMLNGWFADCPHREKAGWTGDAQANIDASLYYFDAAPFYTKWFDDIAVEQNSETGELPTIAPYLKQHASGGGPYYPSCIVDGPWKLYVTYGDKRVLSRHYDTMLKWIDYLLLKVNDGIMSIFRVGASGEPRVLTEYVGDWLCPKEVKSDMQDSQLFNTLHFLYTLRVFSKICDILGYEEQCLKINEQCTTIIVAIQKHYWDDEKGFYGNGNQTYQAFPLLLDIVPDERKEQVAEYLIDDIRNKHGNHLTTGMPGTVLLLQWLIESGQAELGYDLFSNRDYPGWAYLLDQGFTTFPECWHGGPSNIHSCFSGSGFWFYEALGGIRPNDEYPGFERFVIRPQVIKQLDYVNVSYRSIRGLIRSHWKRVEDGWLFEFEVPASSLATVELPTHLGTVHPIVSNEHNNSLQRTQSESKFELTGGIWEFRIGLKLST